MDTGKKLKGARLPGPCPFNMTDELASLTNRVKLRSKNISGPGKFSVLCRNTICAYFINGINNLSDKRVLFPVWRQCRTRHDCIDRLSKELSPVGTAKSL